MLEKEKRCCSSMSYVCKESSELFPIQDWKCVSALTVIKSWLWNKRFCHLAKEVESLQIVGAVRCWILYCRVYGLGTIFTNYTWGINIFVLQGLCKMNPYTAWLLFQVDRCRPGFSDSPAAFRRFKYAFLLHIFSSLTCYPVDVSTTKRRHEGWYKGSPEREANLGTWPFVQLIYQTFNEPHSE